MSDELLLDLAALVVLASGRPVERLSRSEEAVLERLASRLSPKTQRDPASIGRAIAAHFSEIDLPKHLVAAVDRAVRSVLIEGCALVEPAQGVGLGPAKATTHHPAGSALLRFMADEQKKKERR